VAAFAQRAVVFDYDDVKDYSLYRACTDYVVFERRHRNGEFFAAISVAHFQRLWYGQQFELWKAPYPANCTLHGDRWRTGSPS
jgi:hypothetical protein